MSVSGDERVESDFDVKVNSSKSEQNGFGEANQLLTKFGYKLASVHQSHLNPFHLFLVMKDPQLQGDAAIQCSLV